MEDLGSSNMIPPPQHIVRICFVMCIIGIGLFATGIGFALLEGFGAIHTTSRVDTIFGIVLCAGVVLIVTAILWIQPQSKRNT